MRIGYARVSTTDQNLDLQRDALRRAACVRIHEDRASGSDRDRPQLRTCLARLAPGDRLGRSLADLIRIVADLDQRSVAFESLMERIETVLPAGRLMFHVLGALAEFERNLIRERILAGPAAARARGRPIGRPRKLNHEWVRKLRALVRRNGMTVARAAEHLGVSRATAFRALVRRDETVVGACGVIKKPVVIMKKYVFKIKRARLEVVKSRSPGNSIALSGVARPGMTVEFIPGLTQSLK